MSEKPKPPICESCGIRHEVDEVPELDKEVWVNMTNAEQRVAIQGWSVKQLCHYMPGVNSVAMLLAGLMANIPAGDACLAMAVVTGQLLFDAEMNAAELAVVRQDPTIADATLDNRIETLNAVMRNAYTGLREVIKLNPELAHGDKKVM